MRHQGPPDEVVIIRYIAELPPERQFARRAFWRVVWPELYGEIFHGPDHGAHKEAGTCPALDTNPSHPAPDRRDQSPH